MLQHVADAFTAAAVLAGLWAALLWWRSTRVQVEPDVEVGDPSWRDAIVGADNRISTFNSRAAPWTVTSVALQAVATVFGRLAMP